MKRRSTRAVVGAALCAALAACGGPAEAAPEQALSRSGRFGSLRDLVLFERPELGASKALFFDRFEATRADWAGFAATPAGRAVGADLVLVVGDPALPVSGIDLAQARRFARWRFLRLPRSDEWWLAAVGGRGQNLFPWGRREDSTRANTLELGLGRPTPVGVFESGRRSGGNQPYDWIGNVSEWTETVPTWWEDQRLSDGGQAAALDPVSGYAACRRAVLATPALAVWQGVGGIVPVVWLHAAGGRYLPREVLGSDFQSPLAATVALVPAGDRLARVGVRLCTTAGELLAALTAADEEPGASDRLQLVRFVRRGRHRDVLREAWLEAPPLAAGQRTVFDLLQHELGLADRGG